MDPSAPPRPALLALATALTPGFEPHRRSDVAVPDWCFDAWPEAGVPQGGYDAACAALAAEGATPAADGRLCWCGTAHHHPSRMKLLKLAKEHPTLLACSNVTDRRAAPAGGEAAVAASDPAFMSLLQRGAGATPTLSLLLSTPLRCEPTAAQASLEGWAFAPLLPQRWVPSDTCSTSKARATLAVRLDISTLQPFALPPDCATAAHWFGLAHT